MLTFYRMWLQDQIENEDHECEKLKSCSGPAVNANLVVWPWTYGEHTEQLHIAILTNLI